MEFGPCDPSCNFSLVAFIYQKNSLKPEAYSLESKSKVRIQCCGYIDVFFPSIIGSLCRGELLCHLFWRSRHHGTLRRFVLALEFIAHLLHRYPFDSLMLVDILNNPNSDVSDYQITFYS